MTEHLNNAHSSGISMTAFGQINPAGMEVQLLSILLSETDTYL